MKASRFMFITVVAVLALSTLACTINVNLPEIKTGETKTFTVSEKASSGDARLDINMGAGELALKDGSDRLVEGAIQYNVEGWEPFVTRDGSHVTISQRSDLKGLPTKNLVNRWDLNLGSKTPLDLRIGAGAYRGTMELGGIPIKRLEIADGASTVDVSFNERNPVEMSLFQYHSGASTITLEGLGNANFDEMIFEAGAGSYTLDFSGELQRDANVRVAGGVSTVKIVIPHGVNCEIHMTGALNNINASGTWTLEGNTYVTAGSGPKLRITVDMGVGNLDLVHR